jgi:hypothetical protein
VHGILGWVLVVYLTVWLVVGMVLSGLDHDRLWWVAGAAWPLLLAWWAWRVARRWARDT